MPSCRDNGSMTIDSGRFAAAGIVAGSEDTICPVPLAPISIESLGRSGFAKQFLYISWFGVFLGGRDPFAEDAMVTIIEHKKNRITMIGTGGCGKQVTERISYLERIK